jgi:hypothetical protein
MISPTQKAAVTKAAMLVQQAGTLQPYSEGQSPGVDQNHMFANKSANIGFAYATGNANISMSS